MELNHEQIRDRICEIMGWTPPPPLSTLCGWTLGGVNMLSDPLSDLNACAEFEKMLLDRSKIDDRTSPFHRYFEKLHAECANSDAFEVPMKAENWAVCATAPQRCRAFVALHESKSVPNGGKL